LNLPFTLLVNGLDYQQNFAIKEKLKDEIRALQLPDDIQEAAKVMNEKYGFLIPLIMAKSNVNTFKKTKIIAVWITLFGIIYLVGIAVALGIALA
jgi:hypothetical protein